ncbi:hypothetical protein [Streptomyces sp. PvR034]|uniref:hypothetical protein n=1 Tax=Streptomyces sp. PvR034 TaxID=3156401 RepID=UPI003392EA96
MACSRSSRCRSTAATRRGRAGIRCSSDKTVDWEDGNTYPVVDVVISRASHPFHTGTARVEEFPRRYGSR